MKKTSLYLLLALAAAVVTTGCVHEEDDIFDASAAERLNASSEKYTSMLQNAEGGWLIEYYPTNDNAPTTGEGYLWMAKFKQDMSVDVGMNNYFSGNTYQEHNSAWEVITDNGPVLTFNSYNPNVHAFSDPDVRSIPGSSDNVWGTGVGGDYEFVIVQAPTDDSPFVMLKGKKHGTYNRMTPLPAGTDFAEYLADVKAFHNHIFPSNVVNENVLEVGGEKLSVNSGSTGIFGAYPYNGDALTMTTDHPFLITKRDGRYYLRFRAAFTGGEESEQEFVYDEENDLFVGTANAANTLSGDNPSRFFDLWLQEGHKWNFVYNQQTVQAMSEALQPYYDAATKALQSASAVWSIFTQEYVLEGDTLHNNLTLRNRRNQRVNYTYDYSYKMQDGQLTLSFLGPVVTEKNKAAQTILETTPELKAYLEAFAGTYTQSSATGSKFNLNKMRLQATDAQDKWFELTYQR